MIARFEWYPPNGRMVQWLHLYHKTVPQKRACSTPDESCYSPFNGAKDLIGPTVEFTGLMLRGRGHPSSSSLRGQHHWHVLDMARTPRLPLWGPMAYLSSLGTGDIVKNLVP